MADLDTMVKRGSGINPACPWRGPMVFAFITFDQDDRQAADYMYAGILASAAVAGQPYRKRLGGIPFAAHQRGVW